MLRAPRTAPPKLGEMCLQQAAASRLGERGLPKLWEPAGLWDGASSTSQMCLGTAAKHWDQGEHEEDEGL